jgi:hypothetical protein
VSQKPRAVQVKFRMPRNHIPMPFRKTKKDSSQRDFALVGRLMLGTEAWRCDQTTESFQQGQRTAVIIGDKRSENRGRLRRTGVLCKQVNGPWRFEPGLPNRVGLYGEAL